MRATISAFTALHGAATNTFTRAQAFLDFAPELGGLAEGEPAHTNLPSVYSSSGFARGDGSKAIARQSDSVVMARASLGDGRSIVEVLLGSTGIVPGKSVSEQGRLLTGGLV